MASNLYMSRSFTKRRLWSIVSNALAKFMKIPNIVLLWSRAPRALLLKFIKASEVHLLFWNPRGVITSLLSRKTFSWAVLFSLKSLRILGGSISVCNFRLYSYTITRASFILAGTVPFAYRLITWHRGIVKNLEAAFIQQAGISSGTVDFYLFKPLRSCAAISSVTGDNETLANCWLVITQCTKYIGSLGVALMLNSDQL